MVDTEPPGYPYGWNQWIDLIGTGFAWEKVNSYSTQSAKNHRNTYLSKKKLYVDHGWPDNFDGEGFREARDRWQAEIDRYWREDELRWREAGGGPSGLRMMEREDYSAFMRQVQEQMLFYKGAPISDP
jgi:hypothetical protein